MIADAGRALLGAFVLALAAFGAGSRIGKLLPGSFTPLDRLACTWLAGFGVLGTTLFLVGQLAFNPVTISLIVGAGVFLAIGQILREHKNRTREHETLNVPVLPAMVISLVLVLTLLAGLADITGDWGNDGVAYHLLGPKVWLREGVVRPVLDNCHTAFPPTAEVLYGALMWLGGRHGPGLFSVISLGMLLLMVAALCVRVGEDHRGAWWAAAFVASMPAVYSGAHAGFVDVFYASFVLAAARLAFDAEHPRELVAAGLLSGFAIGTKYTGLLALVALLVSSALAMKGRGIRLHVGVRSSAIVLAVALLVGAPAYVRNWILLGCPIYPPPPVLANFFAVKYLPTEAVRGFHAYIRQRGAGLGQSFGAYLLLPFNLTYHTANFNGAGGIGLYALGLAPFGLIARRRNGFARALVVLGLLLATLWFVTQQESRFLIHVYAIGAVFAAAGFRYVRYASPRSAAVLGGALIGCSLCYGLFMIGKDRADDIRSVFSSSFAEHRRQEGIPFRESFQLLNHDPSVRKVLILDPTVPPYYCDKDYVKAFGQWGERPFRDISTPKDALDRVATLGVSHILDVKSKISGFEVPDHSPGLVLVFDEPDQRIYRVAPQP